MFRTVNMKLWNKFHYYYFYHQGSRGDSGKSIIPGEIGFDGDDGKITKKERKLDKISLN